MAFNKTQTIKAVEAKITEQNLLPTVKAYRKMGEAGLVQAMQAMKSAVSEWQVVTLLISLDTKLNGVNLSSPLAEQIWGQQGQKLAQYEGNAHRLSEKQLAVIARHFMQRTLTVEFSG